MKPASALTYEEALAYIASLEPRGWRLGLDRMTEFVRRAALTGSLGRAKGPQFIHVAGTNGKGSVTAFLQSILIESGYRTGAFFSPYVFDPRERVQFGRELIPGDRLAEITSNLQPIAESLSDTEFGGVTEFEFKTAVGFQYWKEMHCDWVALEVGLGGRLDATNVVTPRASVIVSIGLDHTAILGETHAKIAYEKAGVIKPGVPLILGEVNQEAREVILGVAKEHAAPVWEYGHEIEANYSANGLTVKLPSATVTGLQGGIGGVKQSHNLSLAVAALYASGAQRNQQGFISGALRAELPGRLQSFIWRERRFILDGAHNAEAAEALSRSLPSARKTVLVSGMVAGHDPARFFSPLAKVSTFAHLAPIAFHRGVPPDKLQAEIDSVIPSRAHAKLTLALEAAIHETSPDDLILVTGSFYLVGEVGHLIGIN